MNGVHLASDGLIVTCSSCGQKSRLSTGHLSRQGRCASCKTPIPPLGRPVEVPSMADFDALISTADVPVLVDFWAPWCGPCRAVAPEFERVAAQQAGRLLVAKVNTETQPDLGIRYQIRAIPTMALFADGREIARMSGARPAAEIQRFVAEALDRL